MDKEIFVHNIKKWCIARNVKPTVACKEAGVGGSFISDINRGQVPSVAKVQMLAEYLGVTTSDLLGEKQDGPSTPVPGDPSPDFIVKFRNLSPDDQEEVMAIIELKHSKKKKP